MNQEAEIPSFLLESAEDAEQLRSFGQTVVEFEDAGGVSFDSRAADLMAMIEQAPLKYAPFFDRAAEMLETSADEVEKLLEPGGFRRSPLPGIRYKQVSGRLSTPGTVGTVVRFSAGVVYPRHRHKSRERLLVLEGGYTDDSGKHYAAGDLHEMPPGSEHGFVVDTDGPCVAVSVADEKLEFSSVILRFLARLIGR
jgi:quercetin dioxygenase-like cupin family protein